MADSSQWSLGSEGLSQSTTVCRAHREATALSAVLVESLCFERRHFGLSSRGRMNRVRLQPRRIAVFEMAPVQHVHIGVGLREPGLEASI